MDYCDWVNQKVDVFYDKNGERSLDMNIYNEIFDFLDESNFKNEEPKLFEAELHRIRDLYNTLTYAYEQGYQQGLREAKYKQ
jgi:hypothetical protein